MVCNVCECATYLDSAHRTYTIQDDVRASKCIYIYRTASYYYRDALWAFWPSKLLRPIQYIHVEIMKRQPDPTPRFSSFYMFILLAKTAPSISHYCVAVTQPVQVFQLCSNVHVLCKLGRTTVLSQQWANPWRWRTRPYGLVAFSIDKRLSTDRPNTVPSQHSATFHEIHWWRFLEVQEWGGIHWNSQTTTTTSWKTTTKN